MSKNTNTENPKPRKVTITYPEYEAIRYGMNEIDNLIMSGQFAWAKLEKVEKENKEMKRELAKVASKLLNYYY